MAKIFVNFARKKKIRGKEKESFLLERVEKYKLFCSILVLRLNKLISEFTTEQHFKQNFNELKCEKKLKIFSESVTRFI